MMPTTSPAPTAAKAPSPSHASGPSTGPASARLTDDFSTAFGDARSDRDMTRPPADSTRHAARRDDRPAGADPHGTRRTAGHGQDRERDEDPERDTGATAAAAILALLALTKPAAGTSGQVVGKGATDSVGDARESAAALRQAIGQTAAKAGESPLGDVDTDVLGGDKTVEDGNAAAKDPGTATASDKIQGGSGPNKGRDGTTASILAALRAGSASGSTRGDARLTPLGAHDRHGDASPTAAAVGTSPPASPGGTTAVIQRSLSLPVDHPRWSQAVAEAIVDASGPNGGRLKLQIHPADLGPVDIALDIRDDRAKVQINALQPATRAALQQAIPQLTALLAGQGLQLTHADVSAGQSQHQQAQGDASPTAADAETPSPVAVGATSRTLLLRNGLIDDYA